MEEQRARQEQEARRGQASSGADASTSRPETINESKETYHCYLKHMRIIIFLWIVKINFTI